MKRVDANRPIRKTRTLEDFNESAARWAGHTASEKELIPWPSVF